MFKFLKNLLSKKRSGDEAETYSPPLRASNPAAPNQNRTATGQNRVGATKPGKAKMIREDAGTHDDLKIIDESLFVEEEDDGSVDPYNTGRFDRSKNWSGRTR